MSKKAPSSADNILHNVISVAMKPKIYAIMLSSREQDYLGIAISFSLEDAIHEVRQKAVVETKMNVSTAQTHLWSILSMEELKMKVFSAEIVQTSDDKNHSEVRTKAEMNFINKIMQDIVDKNDVELYSKIKKNLNDKEKSYLEDKLFKK